MTGKEARRHVEERLGEPLGAVCLFPRYVYIETVNACNARCIMCGIDFDTKKRTVMDDALFARVADELAEYGKELKRVGLFLDGEPLLDPKLDQRLAILRERGVGKRYLNTNASLLDTERAESLASAGLDMIYISIDSLRKEVYERIRKGLDFETVYNNTREFIRARNRLNPELAIRIQMIQQELNRDEAGSFLEHWSPLLRRNDEVVVNRVSNWASAAKVMRFGDEDEIGGRPCVALWSTFVIHVDGTVNLCCADWKGYGRLGNVKRQSIADIWRGERLARIRDLHIEGRREEIPLCNGCTEWREAPAMRQSGRC